ncbi:unnamed protein product [Cutaneotrichosporon oleaginosum]
MGHPGRAGTMGNVLRRYWWPSVRADVETFVGECDVCQKTKPRPGKPLGHLLPLPVAERPWQHVAADFVGPLPSSGGFSTILVIVDRFSKMAVFTPCKKTATAEDWARMFVDKVYCRFGLPSSVVTDRGSVFTSKFWRTMADILGVKHRLSTAYHPQTDGQTEIVNKALGQYLRVFGNYASSNWASLLPQAEFWYNSSTHSTLGMSPLEACGFQPRRTFDEPPMTALGSVNAVATARRMAMLRSFLQQRIADANDRYRVTYNSGRRDVIFSVGDRVLISQANARQLRPSKKLSDKWAGPFTISEVVNNGAYRLDLPPGMGIHPVVNVDKLRPYRGGRKETIAPATERRVREPADITARRVVGGTAQWRVRWSDGETSWETDDTVTASPTWDELKRSFRPIESPVTESRRPDTATTRGRAAAATPRGWKGWAAVPDDYVAPPERRDAVGERLRTRGQTLRARTERTE